MLVFTSNGANCCAHCESERYEIAPDGVQNFRFDASPMRALEGYAGYDECSRENTEGDDDYRRKNSAGG